MADAIEKLRALGDKGVTTIVDPTVIGLGRYIPRLQRIAPEVPVQIVVATGVYTYGDLPFVYAQRGPGAPLGGDEPMVADFVRDITEGIAGTGVKAAFLKCAVEHPDLSPGVERALRAVAATHKETGVPITVHTNPGAQTGTKVVDDPREEGADLTKVVLGHSGDSNDLDHLKSLADTGAILGMDRFGSTSTTRPTTGCRRSWRWPPTATPTAWSSATTRPATSTGSVRTSCSCTRRSRRTGTTSTSPTTCCPPSSTEASPRPRSTR